MRFCLLPLFGLLAPAWALAQPPTPQSIDQLAEQVSGIRRQRAELDKAESAALASIAAELKRQRELLEKLGIDGPAPKPPTPPTPPTPPAPVDPLRSKLKTALDAGAGTSAEKGEWARDLAALYRAAAKLAGDSSLSTAGALRLKLKEAAAALIGEAALREVRQVVAVELAAVLPTTDGELTSDQRAGAADLFRKLAAHLEDLAK
ncbi:hypothetical protein GobsT_71230 [Gemmata obscuriglobus]|uniref:Uncharacterized protein n=1 Tax=Gemmata obscuriglobus TaxID=114 RepID=A0A2Z3H6Y0_9BACT|nr:hypothetical protein [Gemmata obscuriglobus]AWM41773.1 hypothetical protein C1280_35445 [Gemmata obscuriglobus]QEG32270.1 hypothetical protein GobsT_71230 [Gemmata obscuriglobus]VTS11626.1 unnamed protein product [Gemmata obscuriglobus UQM 2246]